MFRGVLPGDYTLRVEAFGYVDLERPVRVVNDTIVLVPLQVAPLPLDSILIELGTLDFDGRVRDPARNSNVMDAQIVSDQGHEEWTNIHGRFDLDDVFERIPMRVWIRAFGYMPLDTTFVPDGDERYPFNLVPDRIMERMIEAQVERLEARAGDHRYKFRPAINRDDMSRFTGNGTVQSVMEATYPRHILRRIGCFFLDEREIRTRPERTHVLQSTMANELQRIELLEFPGMGRLFMVRIYTRAFFQRLVGSDTPMRIPTMVPTVCR